MPPEAETMLAEMRTGLKASIEPSLHLTGHVDVVFDDETDNPFSVAIDPKQIDRALTPGAGRLAVWTWKGLQMELECMIKQ